MGLFREFPVTLLVEISVEDEISDWLRRNADLYDIESLNAKLLGDGLKMCKPSFRRQLSQRCILTNPAKTIPIFEVLLQDDRLMFPDHFLVGSKV
jgi:hypothetical protein